MKYEESRFKGFLHVRLRRIGGAEGADDELSVIAGRPRSNPNPNSSPKPDLNSNPNPTTPTLTLTLILPPLPLSPSPNPTRPPDERHQEGG